MTLTKGQYQLGDIVMGNGTNIIVTGFEVQRFAVAATATRPGTNPNAVRITAPKRALD